MKIFLLFVFLFGMSLAGMPGGWQDLNLEDSDTISLGHQALGLFNDSETNGLAQRLVEVKSAESQVESHYIFLINSIIIVVLPPLISPLLITNIEVF